MSIDPIWRAGAESDGAASADVEFSTNFGLAASSAQHFSGTASFNATTAAYGSYNLAGESSQLQLGLRVYQPANWAFSPHPGWLVALWSDAGLEIGLTVADSTNNLCYVFINPDGAHQTAPESYLSDALGHFT